MRASAAPAACPLRGQGRPRGRSRCTSPWRAIVLKSIDCRSIRNAGRASARAGLGVGLAGLANHRDPGDHLSPSRRPPLVVARIRAGARGDPEALFEGRGEVEQERACRYMTTSARPAPLARITHEKWMNTERFGRDGCGGYAQLQRRALPLERGPFQTGSDVGVDDHRKYLAVSNAHLSGAPRRNARPVGGCQSLDSRYGARADPARCLRAVRILA